MFDSLALGSAKRSIIQVGRATLRHVRARLRLRPAPAILMYHRIADDPFDPWGTIVSPQRFEEQVAWLATHRTVLPLPEFAQAHRLRQLPRDAIAITFDDGYACNVEIAAPLLQRLQLPATIFLPVEWIEKRQIYWWDEIRAIVFENRRDALRLKGRHIDLGQPEQRDDEWRYGAEPQTPRQGAFHEVSLELILKPPAELQEAMAELRSQFDPMGSRKPQPNPMSPKQIRDTANQGIEFGSHALRHPALTSLTTAGKREEILGSMARCEGLTGARPKSFAYPYGMFDPESEQLVKEAGFTCACSVETASVAPGSRIYALPRMQVGNWTGAQLVRALALL